MKYDTIIIGAGMSGLAAAIRLAHFGKKVVILERHYRIGGMNSYYRKDRHNFDVGLHALTNYDPDGPKSAPLKRLTRSLRIKLSDLNLVPQKESRIVFPDKTLTFDNDIGRLTQSIADNFGSEADNFRKLISVINEHDGFDISKPWSSAKERVGTVIDDPTLVDMLFLPLMFYGSATEEDMDFSQFVTMFKSIYLEGFARPVGGIRPFLDVLLKRIEESGAVVKLRCGVKKIETKDGLVTGVVTDDGEQIECDSLLSSAGHPETVGLCPESIDKSRPPINGRMSFAESINILDKPLNDLGEEASIIFYNNSDTLHFRKPDSLIDPNSGVICMPGNFAYGENKVDDEIKKTIRITNMADPFRWEQLDGDNYIEAKDNAGEEAAKGASMATLDIANHVKYRDVFTPNTVSRFTSRINGAIYGSPEKNRTGETAIRNLKLIGSDQGYVGVVGATLSGVIIANDLMSD